LNPLPVPVPRAAPQPRLAPQPLPVPAPQPVPKPAPAPRPRPPQLYKPVDSPLTGLGTLTTLKPFPVPKEEEDACKRCDQKRNKAKKKAEPRTECHKGTYVQRKKGIQFNPQETIPCQ
jgi:hypothetical protein